MSETFGPRTMAAIDLLRRTGLGALDIRFQDDHLPIVWIAVGTWQDSKHEAAAGMNPDLAVLRLCETVVDGGQCTHCGKVAGFSADVDHLPGGDFVCWYQWDPELKTFRRGCEGS